MVYPCNHKTVLVLDHGPKFQQSCNEPYSFDNVGNKAKQTAIPLAPLYKTHWTCSIEAGVEFCRIVFDIYTKKKLVSCVTSDGEVITNWSREHQDTETILHLFGLLGMRKPNKSDDQSITTGLAAAIDQVLTPTPQQKEARLALRENADQLQNNGQVVAITQARNDSQVTEFIRHFHSTLSYRNKEALQSDDNIQIRLCELVIIIIHPIDKTCKVEPRDRYEVSPNLNVTVIVTESGKRLAHKMVSLAVKFYDLCITSVTGIPMKEEQNANSSANYDVELLHPKEAHGDILKEIADASLAPSKEIQGVSSVTLKWCTPKSQNNSDMQLCSGAFAVSPVDVNSRPSLCLTNFLLAGRSVMLEQPRKSGTKIISHMLTSHGGGIYIHQLITGRSILDDPPSISEGVGGRITDYRISDFAETLIKDNSLRPNVDKINGQTGVEQAAANMDRLTRVWPITLSDTILFNLQSHLEPLPSLIVRESLTEDHVLECQKAIFNLIGFEERNMLNVLTVYKGKGQKKEDQSRMMWTELDEFLLAHSSTSQKHKQIYEIFLNCRPNPTELDSYKRKRSPKSEPDNNESPEDSRKSRTESPVQKKSKYSVPLVIKPGNSVLSMWQDRLNTINSSRHDEFAGRQPGAGNRAQLYKKFADALTEGPDESTPGTKDCPDH